ncbi:hypothetical protein [Egicoccus sp. AB-alg6-2]|uniref:hypothetical protein n=1 Tax=Egicoccus sp. AB-alg6-2 TaxID=3242692 RepID=UPI00359E5514
MHVLMVAAMLLTMLAGPAAADSAVPAGGDYDIKIVGNARLYPWNGVIDGTTVALNVRVRCPAGETAVVPFAGMPDAFGGQFPAPYLPGHTSPAVYGGLVQCTGGWVKATTVARSVARLQNPATHPFEYFSHGRVAFVVEIAGWPDPLATHSKTLQVVVPGRRGAGGTQPGVRAA